MTAFDDEATLAAYVADETAWGQFAAAHTTERLEIIGELAAGGLIFAQGGEFVLKTQAGREVDRYPSIEAARRDLQPGGKWWPL